LKELKFGAVREATLYVGGLIATVAMASIPLERLGIAMGYDLHVIVVDEDNTKRRGECVGIGILDPGMWPDVEYHCLGLAVPDPDSEDDIRKYDGILLLQLPESFRSNSETEDEFMRIGWFFGLGNYLDHAKERRIWIC